MRLTHCEFWFCWRPWCQLDIPPNLTSPGSKFPPRAGDRLWLRDQEADRSLQLWFLWFSHAPNTQARFCNTFPTKPRREPMSNHFLIGLLWKQPFLVGRGHSIGTLSVFKNYFECCNRLDPKANIESKLRCCFSYNSLLANCLRLPHQKEQDTF